MNIAHCSRGCSEEPYIIQGGSWLCKKHYRFQQMRVSAKRKGKSVPTYDFLEKEKQKIGELYPCCEREINWLSKEGQSTVITLQHNRDGTIALICRACNTRHAKRPLDTFYDIPKDSKICPRCNTMKNLESFGAAKNRWMGKSSYCKSCDSLRSQMKWKQSVMKRNIICGQDIPTVKEEQDE